MTRVSIKCMNTQCWWKSFFIPENLFTDGIIHSGLIDNNMVDFFYPVPASGVRARYPMCDGWDESHRFSAGQRCCRQSSQRYILCSPLWECVCQEWLYDCSKQVVLVHVMSASKEVKFTCDDCSLSPFVCYPGLRLLEVGPKRSHSLTNFSDCCTGGLGVPTLNFPQ